MSQGADTLQTASSAPPADSSLSNDPLFKVSEGRPPDPTAPETEGSQKITNNHIGFSGILPKKKNILLSNHFLLVVSNEYSNPVFLSRS
jgi:hypothetical protein